MWMGGWGGREEGWETYNKPMRNTTERPIFSRRGQFILWMIGSGKVMIMRSLETLMAAPAYQKASRLIQAPTMDLSQTWGIGTHWKTVTRMLQTA